MNTLSFSIRGCSILLLLTLFLGSAWAEDGALNPAQLAIHTSSEKLKARLQSEKFRQDFKGVTRFVDQVIQPNVDFPRISALVLGKYWRQASRPERERFVREFRILLVRTYSRAFIQFNEWSVHFLPMALADNETKTLVRTEVLQPGKQPIGVDYRMIKKNGQWKAYDIVIEGVSLVTNYRSTFANQILNLGSLEKVIDALAERNAAAFNKAAS